MKKTIARNFFLLISCMLCFSQLYAQKSEQQILDSILYEADLLYSYEKAIWNSTDLIRKRKDLMENFGGYVIYHYEDSIYATYLNKDRTHRLIQFVYLFTDLDNHVAVNIDQPALNSIEKTLWRVKLNVALGLGEPQFKFETINGYNPNLIVLQANEYYKTYILRGTEKQKSIPLGSDYYFLTDDEGTIIEWQKFHSVLLDQGNGLAGLKAVSIVHSHLQSTPYITATDICTFRLYAPAMGIYTLSVVSTAKNKVYSYSTKTNKISVKDI